MHKQNEVDTHNGVLLSLKEEILRHARPWMNLKDIMLREINQNPKRQILTDCTYVRDIRVLKFIQTESRIAVPRAWERE